MPEKLQLHAETKKPIAFDTLKVYPETAKIINDLVAETGITKVKLIHQLIAYAAENAEIIDESEV